MIVPYYNQATSVVTYTADILGKWYCAYHEVDSDGKRYARYMTPKGWARGTHWYSSFEECVKDFDKMGQTPLGIEQFERDMRREEEEWWEDQQRYDFEKMMEEQLENLLNDR